MKNVSSEQINSIRESVDIVDIVGNYIALTKKGKNYFGVCPFHEDSDPSLSVSPDKQIFSCFSCHTAGNVFSFVKEFEHVNFIAAVKIVADKAGINLDIGQYQPTIKNNELYEIYDISNKFYQNNINTQAGQLAKKYLETRNINDDLIKEFGIGLALKYNNKLAGVLLKKNFNEKHLLDSGLLVKNDFEFNDIFRNRIMFPITDINDKVVGYSGRVFDNSDTSKYINTKETVLFKKSELLYNYARAKNECRIKDTVIIMEGFLDVIRAHSIGVRNVVATMGTAFTKQHISLIKRLANNVILAFDGDKAGIKAGLACSDILIKNNVPVKIVVLEDGLDPDDYIIKKGKEAFLDKLNNPINILDFKMNYYKQNKDFQQNEDVSNYVKEVLLELNKTNDEILIELALKKLSLETNLDYEFLKKKINNKPEKEVKKIVTKSYDKYAKAQMGFIYYMLRSKEVIKIYDNQTLYFPDSDFRLLASQISYFYNKKDYIKVADLINELDSDLIKIVGQIESLELNEEYTTELIMDYVKSIREYNLIEQIKRIDEKIAKETDEVKKATLAQQILELKMRSEEDV